MIKKPPILPAEVVARLTTEQLRSSCATPVTYLPDRVLMKSWSTIYILRSNDREGTRLVVKIARYPDQDDVEVSWQAHDLLTRGRREYQCLANVAGHFKFAPDELEAVRPHQYIEPINAVVMDFIPGKTIWSAVLRPHQLLHDQGIQQAEQTLYRVGEWLRWLHKIELDEPTEGRVLTTSAIIEKLVNFASLLEEWGLKPQAWDGWADVLSILETAEDQDEVWLHGDFHPGNLRMLPNSHVLSFDTALECYGSPYEDLGKFIAALKARRLRILLRGRFPSDSVIGKLESALLNGYMRGQKVNLLSLRLYEGRYLFQKWIESLTNIEARFPVIGVSHLARILVHPFFLRMARDWMGVIQMHKIESC